ncbi:hypothetical protein SAMN04487897_14011 [Paenibacillus sp. yr247]|nr:hypothetical protein SAMN04487897_14011 [Paenibacillus sp. yr247]
MIAIYENDNIAEKSETPAGSTAWRKRKHKGTREIQRDLHRKKWSTLTKRTIHREADVVVEVGLAGSTRNVGKPRTGGFCQTHLLLVSI